MKGKVAFVIGAGLGYILGTRAGREQYDKLKAGLQSALDHPAVKDRVAKAESAINDVVRDQGSQMSDRVANAVKDRFGAGSATNDAPVEDTPGNWDTRR
ncbi:MAG: YtxH domain-containing protein [Beutenbergiaceae bacterium]